MFSRTPDHVWAIVPFSRPRMLARLLENVRRQTFPCRLVVVANGAARNVQRSDGTWLTSEAHQSAAKNEGLEFVRRLGGGFFAIFDDDDWYGPDYVAELVRNAHRADVVGKRRHLVHLEDGVYLFDEVGANRPTEWVTGACTAGWAEDAVEFPTVDCGEDAAWCGAMRAKGATFWATSVWNFVYDHRGPGHRWQASDTVVRRMLGDAVRFDRVPDTLFAPLPSNDAVFETLQRSFDQWVSQSIRKLKRRARCNTR